MLAVRSMFQAVVPSADGMTSQAPLVPRVLARAWKSGVGLPEVNAHPPLAAASCLSLVGPLHPWPGLVARIASGTHLLGRLFTDYS